MFDMTIRKVLEGSPELRTGEPVQHMLSVELVETNDSARPGFHYALYFIDGVQVDTMAFNSIRALLGES